jgi:hypothetical protein
MCTDVCHAQILEPDLLDVVAAFEKIFANLDELKT